jgi:hypothetical protein
MILEKVIAACVLFGICFATYKLWKSQHRTEYKWSVSEFETMTVNEKAQNISTLTNRLHAIEQLQTDLDVCDPIKNVRVIEMKWLGTDDIHHKIDIYADGINGETEIMRDLLELENLRMRSEIAEKTAILYGETNQIARNA